MHPFVSVIIPTYNAERHIQRCIQSVLEQDYPSDKTEIIVADNCSYDNTTGKAQQLAENIIITRECKYPGSPYSARNRGVEASRGEVIVLLDSDCRPEKQWLSNGVDALLAQDADVVGGGVVFSVDETATVAEMYDAIMNIRMKASIQEHRMAKTVNLFIRKSVFTDVGPFPEGWRSGGDVFWTKSLTAAGKHMVYCDSARVYKPPRKLKGLLKKQWRVAKAQPRVWLHQGDYPALLIHLVKFAIPPGTINNNIRENGKPFMSRYVFRLFLLSLIVRPVMILGNISGVFQYFFRTRKHNT